MAKSVLIAHPVSRKVAVCLPPSVEGHGPAGQVTFHQFQSRSSPKKLIAQMLIFRSGFKDSVEISFYFQLMGKMESIAHLH
jgi:hypothetical protein